MEVPGAQPAAPPLVRVGDVADWRLPDEEFLQSFRTADARPGALAQLHPFPKEDRITFAEAGHVYTVDGQRVPRSVTSLVHSFANEFDAARTVDAMGVPEEDRASLLQQWKLNGKVQRVRGQLLHFHAESLLNGCEIEEPHSPEFRQASAVYREFIMALGLQPFRTEICIFHCGLRVAGSVDLLCCDPSDSSLVIIDWKRSKEIRTDTVFRSMRPPLQHIPDCNYWHYALQLNMYRYILESEYGFRVSSMYLAVVHPSLTKPRVIAVPRMEDLIQAIEEHEMQMGRASEPRAGDAPFPPQTDMCY